MSPRVVATLLLVTLLGAVLALLVVRSTNGSSAAPDERRASGDTPASEPARQRAPRRARPRLPAPRARTASMTRAAATPQASPNAPAPVTRQASATSGVVSPRVEQLTTTVLQEAVRGDWLSVDEHGTPCAPQSVRIVYDAPAALGSYEKGAYFEPLGPAPSDSSVEINGLLLCEGSTFLYRGFEAYYRADRGQWDVYPFPIIE